MVEIATVIWQFGGSASRDEVYARFALARGRSASSQADKDAFFRQVTRCIEARAMRSDMPIVVAANDCDGWALSRLALAILGPYPDIGHQP